MSVRSGLLEVRGRRVLITGHTGFKGAWLAEWLLLSGARVSGIALSPESPDTLFETLGLEQRLDHHLCDIRDPDALTATVRRTDPEVIFHLAAQSLVRRSYREPLRTWQTNVTGTLNVLEAAKALGRPVLVIVVTTDKVYKNREWEFAYREVDELGGYDPYSASKAACEIAVASWRSSFGAGDGVAVVTARAGNVLGGGDTSEDRIVPDCFRAWRRGEQVRIRQPKSTRPWQHVLEPLAGYLRLAAYVSEHGTSIETCNFGPEASGICTVERVVQGFVDLDPTRTWGVSADAVLHEARTLSLAIDRAQSVLDWHPRLSFDEMIAWTNAGYVADRRTVRELVARQIAEYTERL